MPQLAFIDIETSALIAGHHRSDSFAYYGELLEVAVILDDGEEVFEHIWRMEPDKPDMHNPKALSVNQYDKRKHHYITRPWAEHIYHIHNILSDRSIVFVGHNVQFDLHWLNFWFDLEGLPPVRVRGIDTITLAHEHLKPAGLHSLSFDTIRRFLGWPLEDAHSALVDARACRRLYYTLIRAGLLMRLYWTMRSYVYSRYY